MLHRGILKKSIFALALAGAMASSGGALAQDTSTATESHPSHIHAGTCDDLDPNPEAPLNNIEPRKDDDDDDASTGEPQGVLTAPQVLYAETDDVDVSWDEMLAESHVLNVHESNVNVQNHIPCGDIGGVVMDDTLVISLHSLNDSGYSGIAILEKDDDDKVDVEVYLATPPTDNDVDATPVS